MKSRGFDPFRLDVQTFAKEEGRLEGTWPLRDLVRVVDSAHSEALPTAEDRVQWAVHGDTRRVRGAEPETWLHLKAGAHLSMVCQRCLQPVPVEIAAHRNFRFVPGEEAATELDADCEDDVLAMVRSLDLRPLIEDELLLSLPLVPMHASCPLPLPMPQADAVVDDESPHPFAALAAFKGRSSGGRG